MLYAERDEEGKITGISVYPSHVDQEPVSDEELTDFIAESTNNRALLALIKVLDIGIIRVLDDLVDLLIKKNIIIFSELPIEAQKKLAKRKTVRKQLRRDPPIIEEEEDLL
jgi:SepF-like predicted cell division protein (DUF552 family)